LTRKTIADIVIEVLKETGNLGIMWGDTVLLDMIANRCDAQLHTTLKTKKDGKTVHPLNRHNRILDALDKDPRFDKKHFHARGMRGNQWWRTFKLKEKNVPS